MSSINDPDPHGGDGPNKDDAPGLSSAAGASGEHREDEGRGEGGVHEGGGEVENAPESASQGINPVQHSE